MSLKVFDLYCDQGHVFEGWFGSANSYETQREQDLITCPVCASHVIGKKLSAPRLNVSHLRNPPVAAAQAKARDQAQDNAVVSDPAPAQAPVAQLQAAVFRHFRELIRKTENVGPQFTELARSMHDGDMPARPIRGTATEDERQELVEEGIAVMPIPEFLDDDRLQ